MQKQTPTPVYHGISDAALENDPEIIGNLGTKSVVPGTVNAMAFGGNDNSSSQTDARLYRLERGYPYKRAGHMVPVMPQFKAQNLTLQNLASQPNANRSVSQIVTPTADPSLTVTTAGVPFIGWPGFNRQNLT